VLEIGAGFLIPKQQHALTNARGQSVFFPKIDADKCKNHGDCFRICPENVFDRDEAGVRVARPGDCTKCDSCVVVCPEKAIKIEEL
jgi:NAD-dependent dihydropyrimidine dehydrogenase PreA subunit